MKSIILRFSFLLFLFCGVINLYAQQPAETITIILLRHAEKDTVGTDPMLSAPGVLRAERLPAVFKDVTPDAMYSTPYKRTQQTLATWAKLTGKNILSYDQKNLRGFAEELKAMKGKTIVVAGHSNTTPMLVNLILGSSKYEALDESVYNKAWVVIIKDGVATDKIIEY